MMISLVVPIMVAVVFLVAIASVWIVKPGSRLWKLQYNGYDDKHPPSKSEWRSAQRRYTVLLVFLGGLSVIVIWMAM